MDHYDALTIIGLILIAVAIYFAFGVVTTVVFLGVVLVIIGLTGAAFGRRGD